jgi:hypothetical protein
MGKQQEKAKAQNRERGQKKIERLLQLSFVFLPKALQKVVLCFFPHDLKTKSY